MATKPLTATVIRNAKPRKKSFRLTDGGGMYLLVTPTGGKLWRLDYRFHGKRRTYSLGPYPEISLREAREKRTEARRWVRHGKDPVQERRREKDEQRASTENTFEKVIERWIDVNKTRWSPRNERVIKGLIQLNFQPWLGKKPITEITEDDLLDVLRRIENRGAIDAAHRCRRLANRIFRFAKVSRLCRYNPAADLEEVMQAHRTTKYTAITNPVEIGGLMRMIDAYSGGEIVRCFLRFLAYTGARQSEARHCEWDEINWIKKLWVVPAKKMKQQRPHSVPLSNQAIKVLQEVHVFSGRGRVTFPSMSVKPMGKDTARQALRYMGIPSEKMVPHGFRSTFSTLAHETGWPHDDIELQLSHVRKDRVAAAYDRSQRLPERRKMMQAYADLLDDLKKDDKIAVSHGE